MCKVFVCLWKYKLINTEIKSDDSAIKEPYLSHGINP